MPDVAARIPDVAAPWSVGCQHLPPEQILHSSYPLMLPTLDLKSVVGVSD